MPGEEVAAAITELVELVVLVAGAQEKQLLELLQAVQLIQEEEVVALPSPILAGQAVQEWQSSVIWDQQLEPAAELSQSQVVM